VYRLKKREEEREELVKKNTVMRFSLNYEEEDEDKSINSKNQDKFQPEIEKEKLIGKKVSKN
jgi:hypothetical protein